MATIKLSKLNVSAYTPVIAVVLVMTIISILATMSATVAWADWCDGRCYCDGPDE